MDAAGAARANSPPHSSEPIAIRIFMVFPFFVVEQRASYGSRAAAGPKEALARLSKQGMPAAKQRAGSYDREPQGEKRSSTAYNALTVAAASIRSAVFLDGVLLGGASLESTDIRVRLGLCRSRTVTSACFVGPAVRFGLFDSLFKF
jgi:hypothetical protein